MSTTRATETTSTLDIRFETRWNAVICVMTLRAQGQQFDSDEDFQAIIERDYTDSVQGARKHLLQIAEGRSIIIRWELAQN